MSKRRLKEQNKDLEIHVVDLIAKFDPTKTGKYTKFLIDILKKKFEKERAVNAALELEEKKYVKKSSRAFTDNLNSLEETVVYFLSEVFDPNNIETLHAFEDHLKSGRIPKEKRDINNYKDWEEIKRETSLATLKQQQKMLEKETLRVSETDEWLVVRPLTFESSLSYGSNTKWCTASKNNSEYFYRYSKNGALCYVINKLNGEKYGLFWDFEDKSFSVWDAPDRRIDSVESTMPLDLVMGLCKYMKQDKSNFFYFSDSEKKRAESQWAKMEILEAPQNELNELLPMRAVEDAYEDYPDSDIDVEQEVYEVENAIQRPLDIGH